MLEYLYSAGLRPEIALCIEYLSWNKEQRLYMAWIRDLYMHLFNEGASSKLAEDLKFLGKNSKQ